MDESEENMSTEDIQNVDSQMSVKIKPKKRSLVERELETNMTARITSPITGEGTSTSRYGRARRLKTGLDIDIEKIMKPLKIDVSKTQPQAYKMHASNSPVRKESPKRTISVGSTIEDQIENIYNENISLSRFGSEEKAKSQSPAKKFGKVYIRKDLIQKPDTDTVVLIKNLFSPNKSNSHINNILERSSEKYDLNGEGKAWNGLDTSSVVKTLDFDGKKKKKDVKEKVSSKSELFELEASCEYQVGDLAWARVGTYPFWPCIVTREPFSDLFVKKKLFGRVERAVIHVTFFGDNGRRGWIVDNMLRKYHGRIEFESAREKFTPESKKKDPRLYAAHFVSDKKLPLWNVSVDEAETLMKEPKRLRIDALYDMLEKARASKTTPKREKGGKITRTDSDVSLSESLYDTLFSEDDGKTDDNNRMKKPRNKSLDVSEVVTACLDNMAAKSGIIQIQRQSHMDRWLQKAKSKTPEKIQPKLQIKVEKEKRKERIKKKVNESKKPNKLRKKESLGSATNLLPYQNEHDYSSVNYENHDINDSSNKNTDSASGHDSTLNSSDLGVTVKIENISSNMDDCSQDDIITTIVNDDIVMTEPENISKDNDCEEKNEIDNVNNRIENENKIQFSKTNDSEQIDTASEEVNSNISTNNNVQRRRSKRKRQTLEGLNNSNTEKNTKEPKLEIEQKPDLDVSSPDCKKDNENQENSTMPDKKVEGTDQEISSTEPKVSKPEIDISHQRIFKPAEVISFNSQSKPVVVIVPLKFDGLEAQITAQSKLLLQKNLEGSGNQNNHITNNLKEPDSSSSVDDKNENVDNILKDDAKTLQESSSDGVADVVTIPDTLTQNEDEKLEQDKVVSGEDNHQVVENATCSEKMEVDIYASHVIAAKEKVDNLTSNLNSDTNSDPTIPLKDKGKNKSKVVVPLDQGNEETLVNIVKKKTDKLTPRVNSDTNSDPTISLKEKVKNKFIVVIEPLDQANEEILINAAKVKLDDVTSSTINSDTIADPTVPFDPAEEKSCKSKVVIAALDQANEETLIQNNTTKVAIGEDTYIFDRTMSQDYDEIDFNPCDEIQNNVSDDKETLQDNQEIGSQNDTENSNPSLTENHDVTTKDGCKPLNKSTDDTNTYNNDFKCLKATVTQSECNLPEVKDNCVTSDEIADKKTDEKARSDLVFLDKEDNRNTDNYEKIINQEDSTPSSLTSDVNVSSISNEEQIKVCNQMTEESNTKCVFLDNSIKITNGPLNDSNEVKRKSPRLSLNRNRNRAVTLNNKLDKKRILHHDTVQSESQNKKTDLKDEIEKAPLSSDDTAVKIARPNENSVETSRPKEKQDFKKVMNDPEFLKYLEIRQDALIDEQPDLTEDEIVTYLYQNWLYEEDNKSDVQKTDDTEQFNLVKGLNQEEAPQQKKIKLKRLKSNKLKEEDNNSAVQKTDDTEQFNLVKVLNQKEVPQPRKIKLRRLKPNKESELKNVDIRSMMHKEVSKPILVKAETHNATMKNVNQLNVREDGHSNEIDDKKFGNRTTECKNSEQNDASMGVSESSELPKAPPNENLKDENAAVQEEKPDQIHLHLNESKEIKISSDSSVTKISDNILSSTDEVNTLAGNNGANQEKEITEEVIDQINNAEIETENTDSKTSIGTDAAPGDYKASLDLETRLEELKVDTKIDNKIIKTDSTESAICNGFVENDEASLESKTNDEFDGETASIKSEDSGVSVTRRRGRPKEKTDTKRAMEDPEFLKYLEARQDALIDEQPDLTQDEIVTYLFQTWFYEESNKSELVKTDDTDQSNLVKGLNQEPAPQPRKYKKKPKVEKQPEVKNLDIRNMIKKEKPKRKITQSKPYYNEDDSDLEEEDLETFKIFDGVEEEIGEEIDEVELYFEKLTKPKPNVFKGYVRERVCEICEIPGNLVKCKSCHGTFHVDCVSKQFTDRCAPATKAKKKRGRKPKGYNAMLDSGSQSDERSQDANNSEEFNMSVEEETGSHLVIDAENFENQWELKIKELQTDNQEEIASDQEMNWELEPGHCEIVDLKHKEKPIDYSDYKCNDCLKYETPICFVCKSNTSPKSETVVRQKCQVAHCHRYYHLECLDHWPQTQFNSWEPSKTNKKVIEYIEALSCPRHVCHTCVSDDPRGCKTRFCGDKLARCVKCPATYHSYTRCLPAGTQILTGSQIICPRHNEHRPGKVPCHVNTGWCFICALGGTLICCEYCPTSFHAECLNIKPPEGSYMCEDCETGRLPLYGEMVWVKLGHYRWWPGIVLHPSEIPDNIRSVKHAPGEFVVRFFGQYDHYWVNRGRVFPFQEGDSGKVSSLKSKIDAAFTTAMEHAQRACEILKKMEPNEEEDMDIASSLLPPHYVKLKVNKPAGNVVRRELDANSLTQCDCDPSQPDPCGPYSHCLNRMLLTECGPLCRAGDRCNNRAFERRSYPRLAAYRTPYRGWGLRTLDDIKHGQFVIEYVGELIDMEEFRRRMCRKHEIRDENFYFLTLDKERMIDAGPKGNLARFMNHCCEPNCETQKWTVLGDIRVGLFALRDIPANSEVTFNYNLECAGIEKKRCLCGAPRCSGYIGAKPKQLQEEPKKVRPPAKRTYKKRKPVEDSPTTTKKVPKIKIKPIKPRELTEIEKDLLIIKNATNGMSSDSEGSRLSSIDEKNPKALKRKRVSFSTEENKKVKLSEDSESVA